MERSGDTAPVAVHRYAVYEAIGSGGMATVHLGRLAGEEGFGRTVAIKRLRAQFVSEPDVVASFVDEARLAARIRHPNVVATIDVVTKGGEVFLVMEYIDGESLASLIRVHEARGERVPPAVAVAVVAGTLQGLHAAHQAVSESGESLQIVHRDVSPTNILVGVDGIARVLDFGVAKALGRQQTTRDGHIKGTLAYMAPEQLSGRGVTRRTDTFAAGIVLWELLTGRRLFRGEDDAQTLTRVLFEPVPRPSEVCADAPAALDPIAMRALDRDPTRRFATAHEMAAALEQAMTPATSRIVGEWVRNVAAEGLDERARRVREIEHRSPTARWLQRGDDSPRATKTGVSISIEPPPARAAEPARARGSYGPRSIATAGLGLLLISLGTAWVARDKGERFTAAQAPAAWVEPASSVPSATASATPPATAVSAPAPAASAPVDAARTAPAPGLPANHGRRPAGARPPPRDPPAGLPVGSARERLYSQD